MKKTDKNYKYRDILTATDCAIANEIDLRYNDSMNKQKNKTFNVCYLREYIDPECDKVNFSMVMIQFTEMYLKSTDQNLILKK